VASPVLLVTLEQREFQDLRDTPEIRAYKALQVLKANKVLQDQLATRDLKDLTARQDLKVFSDLLV